MIFELTSAYTQEVAKNASIAYHTKQGEQEELALSTDSEA